MSRRFKCIMSLSKTKLYFKDSYFNSYSYNMIYNYLIQNLTYLVIFFIRAINLFLSLLILSMQKMYYHTIPFVPIRQNIFLVKKWKRISKNI